MPFEFCGQTIETREGDTVLDALLRAKVQIGFSCMKGECLSCTVKCLEGDPCPDSQEGLTARMRDQKCFKACSCPASLVSRVTRPGR